MRTYSSYSDWIQTLNALFPYHKITSVPGSVLAFNGTTGQAYGEWEYEKKTGWIVG